MGAEKIKNPVESKPKLEFTVRDGNIYKGIYGADGKPEVSSKEFFLFTFKDGRTVLLGRGNDRWQIFFFDGKKFRPLYVDRYSFGHGPIDHLRKKNPKMSLGQSYDYYESILRNNIARDTAHLEALRREKPASQSGSDVIKHGERLESAERTLRETGWQLEHLLRGDMFDRVSVTIFGDIFADSGSNSSAVPFEVILPENVVVHGAKVLSRKELNKIKPSKD